MIEVPARLIVIRGPNSDEEYTLTGVETTLGRSASNTIVLTAPEISRRHAVIYFRGDRHFLEDLGSTNGSFVNGRRLTERVALADGDKVQFGDSTLMSYRGPNAPAQVVDAQPAASLPAARPPAPASPMVPAAEIPTPAPAAPPAGEEDFILDAEPETTDQRRWIIGCGCLPFILAGFCLAALLALDSYQQGRLLYCGPVRPFFEILLGPFGFNPLCVGPL